MAKIVICVPTVAATAYFEEVIGQINDGFTSGDVGANTNWDIEWDTDESVDDLPLVALDISSRGKSGLSGSTRANSALSDTWIGKAWSST